MQQLNIEELGLGSVYGVACFCFLGWWTFPAVLLTAYLWAYSGLDYTSKIWRRLGCPLAVCLPLLISTGNWFVLLGIPAGFGILSIGYGLPSTKTGDRGSRLGRWVYDVVYQDLQDDQPTCEMSNYIVRAILATLLGLSLASLIWINWTWWVVALVLLVVGHLWVVQKLDGIVALGGEFPWIRW